MKDPNKSKIFIGVALILGAFLCVLIVFYFLVNAHRQKLAEIDTMEEQLLALDTEKNAIQRRVDELKDQVGRSIALNKVIDEARNRYGSEEKDRKEGYLWIDHEASTAIVTLGVLNGLSAGKKLAVYDDTNNVIGHLIVETPMDVVSYVRPMGKSFDDFKGNYYRVVIE